jgi:hypothetical protein
MGQEAAVPAGFWPKVQKMVDDAVATFARSGFLRNASISDGGLTIKGGFLRLLFGDVELVNMGPVLPRMPDGSPQIGLIIRRADGTQALAMFDADVSDGQVNQALTWYDRAGNVVLADDTNSGQGIARPYVPGGFYRADYADWLAVTGTSFVTKFRARMPKQQPSLYVRAWASNDTSGATGELRVMVNGVQWGPTQSTAFSISEYEFGPLPVTGEHMSTLAVELQARVTSGSGAVRLEPSRLEGRQT